MKHTKLSTRILAVAAFCIGTTIPLFASATDYGNYLSCLKNCAGSCNIYGRCFLMER